MRVFFLFLSLYYFFFSVLLLLLFLYFVVVGVVGVVIHVHQMFIHRFLIRLFFCNLILLLHSK